MPRISKFSERAMYPFAAKVLKRRYPVRLGWDLKPQYPKNSSYKTDFLLERCRNGKIQKVVAEVKKADRIGSDDISQIRKYASAIAGGNTKIVNRIFILPSGSDISNIPDDIKVIRLTSFKCEADGIWWYNEYF